MYQEYGNKINNLYNNVVTLFANFINRIIIYVTKFKILFMLHHVIMLQNNKIFITVLCICE